MDEVTTAVETAGTLAAEVQQGTSPAPESPTENEQTAAGDAPGTQSETPAEEEISVEALDDLFPEAKGAPDLTRKFDSRSSFKEVREHLDAVQTHAKTAVDAVNKLGGVETVNALADLHTTLSLPKTDVLAVIGTLSKIYGEQRVKQILDHGAATAKAVRDEEVLTRVLGLVPTPEQLAKAREYLLTGGHEILSPAWVDELPDSIKLDADGFLKTVDELRADPYVKNLLIMQERNKRDEAERAEREAQDRQKAESEAQTAAKATVDSSYREIVQKPFQHVVDTYKLNEDEEEDLESRMVREFSGVNPSISTASEKYLQAVLTKDPLAAQHLAKLSSLVKQSLVANAKKVLRHRPATVATKREQLKNAQTGRQPVNGGTPTDSNVDVSTMNARDQVRYRLNHPDTADMARKLVEDARPGS